MGWFTRWYDDPRYNSEGIKATQEPTTSQAVKNSESLVRFSKAWERIRRWGPSVFKGALIATAAVWGIGENWDDIQGTLWSDAPDAPDPTQAKIESVKASATQSVLTPTVAEAVPAPTTVATQPEVTTSPEPTPSDAEAARREQIIKDQSYETERLNTSQYAEHTIDIEPTEESIDSFRTVLASRLGVDESALTDAMVRDVLMNGGYTVPNGPTYEVWQHTTTGEFYFIDNPNQNFPPAIPEPETHTPIEIPDVHMDELLVANAKLLNPPLSSFASEVNPYTEDAVMAEAWEKARATLQTMPSGWEQSQMTLGEFLHKVGFVK